jgi:hypothetical protein
MLSLYLAAALGVWTWSRERLPAAPERLFMMDLAHATMDDEQDVDMTSSSSRDPIEHVAGSLRDDNGEAGGIENHRHYHPYQTNGDGRGSQNEVQVELGFTSSGSTRASGCGVGGSAGNTRGVARRVLRFGWYPVEGVAWKMVLVVLPILLSTYVAISR